MKYGFGFGDGLINKIVCVGQRDKTCFESRRGKIMACIQHVIEEEAEMLLVGALDITVLLRVFLLCKHKTKHAASMRDLQRLISCSSAAALSPAVSALDSWVSL